MAWTTGPDYGLSFGYDGFGNKLSQTVTKGSAPASSITVDANNRITGQTYDANGNMTSGASSTLTYDVDNRVVTAAGLSSESYSYDPSNKRVWKKRALGGGAFAEDVYFYGIDGQRMATFTWNSGGYWTIKSADVRFAGKLLYTNNAWVATDRLGSIRYRKPTGTGERLDFFPYGEERPSATAQDRDKFATYMRDDTGLDYADQRYFTNTSGRFVTPDPAGDGSNWYAYAGGDPANSGDPTGLAAAGFDMFGPPFQAVVEAPQPEMEPASYAFGPPTGSAFNNDGAPGGGCEPQLIHLCYRCTVEPWLPECSGGYPDFAPPPPTTIQMVTSVMAGLFHAGVLEEWGTFDDDESHIWARFNPVIFSNTADITWEVTVTEVLRHATKAILDGIAIGSSTAVLIASSLIMTGDKMHRKWPDCTPPIGSIGYNYHTTHEHYPIAGPHVHLFRQSQNPNNGQCFWSYFDVTAPPPPANAYPLPTSEPYP